MADVYQIHGWQRIKANLFVAVCPRLRQPPRAWDFCWKSGIAAEVIGLPTFSLASTSIITLKVWIRQPFLRGRLWLLMSALGEKIVMRLVSWAAARLEKSCSWYESQLIVPYTAEQLLEVKNITKSFGNKLCLMISCKFERGVRTL